MPQPGDFGLTRISGAAGDAIRVGQWLNGNGFSAYEHAFVVVDNDQIVEAMPGGALLSPLSEYPDSTTVFSTWTLTDVSRRAIVAAAKAMIGTPYSAYDYFAIAAHRLHLPMPGLRSYIATSKHMICSQLVDLAYTAAGCRIFEDGRWPGYVTPGSLVKALAGPVEP